MKDSCQQNWANTRLFKSVALLSVLFALMTVASVWAQTATTGSISGVVTDPSAAVLAGVPVTLSNVDTNSSTSTTTNEQGSYSFSLLQPGGYSVTTNVAGFQTITRHVTVTLGTGITANLQLSLSAQNESVEVSDAVTGVQTEDANLETNFNAQQIAVLPNPGTTSAPSR